MALSLSGLSNKEIAKKMGVGTARVSQLLRQERWALDHPVWWGELSVRVSNVIHNLQIDSKEELRTEFQSGRLSNPKKWPQNYGWLCHEEVANFLGVPFTPKQVYKKLCPHCGKEIK